MTLLDGTLFLVCVAIATFAQTLTGFAFGLILLGLVGALHLAPLADAANVVSVLSLANTFVVLRGTRDSLDVPALKHTLIGSSIGVAIGVALLSWLSGSVVLGLRFVLGLTILACAAVLFLRAKPLARRSSMRAFKSFGLLSGLMSGLFASAGPPLVYQFYRQPMSHAAIRQTLGAVFAANALLRLALVIPTGQFSRHALILGVAAFPLVLGLTWWIKRHPPAWSPRTVKWVVCTLLILSGLSLVVPSAAAWLSGH